MHLDTVNHYYRECKEQSEEEEVDRGLDALAVCLKADAIKSNHAAYADERIRLNDHCHDLAVHK